MIIKIIKDIALLGIAIIAIGALSVLTESLIPWSWLTNFFIIIRHLLDFFNFLLDMDTLTTIIENSFRIMVEFYLLYGTIIIIKWFRD